MTQDTLDFQETTVLARLRAAKNKIIVVRAVMHIPAHLLPLYAEHIQIRMNTAKMMAEKRKS